MAHHNRGEAHLAISDYISQDYLSFIYSSNAFSAALRSCSNAPASAECPTEVGMVEPSEEAARVGQQRACILSQKGHHAAVMAVQKAEASQKDSLAGGQAGNCSS